MEPITIQLKEESGFERTREPVQLGIPFPPGELSSTSSLELASPDNYHVPFFQTAPLAKWPDGSVRWLKLNFLANISPFETSNFELRHSGDHQQLLQSPLRSELKSNEWQINTGKTCFRVPQTELKWFASTVTGAEMLHEIRLTDTESNLCSAEQQQDWQVFESGPACITLSTRGRWQTAQGDTLAKFNCTLRFYADSETAELDVCIHNPNRARHSGGLWDLGDQGSINFQELSVEVTVPDCTDIWLKPEAKQPELRGGTIAGLELYQDSSGGEQWQSRNHVNAQGEVTTRFRGYVVRENDQVFHSGLRATPIICLNGKRHSAQASTRNFWQNFPSALSAGHGKITIGLFPNRAAEPYELQGGEQKNQTVYLNYSSDCQALLWTQAPLTPVLDAAHYEKAEVFPWFFANAPESALEKLIQRGVSGPGNFFAKREVIDEFGWRNFGDLFADHETLYQKKDEPPLISHYNNQYDAIYGFARQFAQTGDTRWFELMDDLARHVVDIDIYHTDQDRAEYNCGLFWHTDHYLNAHTASHRTFSKLNDTSSTPGQTGGGPAAEHCYTTGLLYHYYLTGNTRSRNAVLELAGWIKAAHEGQGGLLEQILALKKKDIPMLKRMLKGERLLAHQYPFTRGTGNYLNALLDAWLLEPEGGWLEQAERVIHATIHPADDIEKRNLLNVETGWSYLVLLTSLAKYLNLKRSLHEKDASYHFTKASFLHYSNWIHQNEIPFLHKSSQLEFANDTWVAQDIRKAMLMFQASELDADHSLEYRIRGLDWLDYVVDTLEKSEENHFSRVLVILMQNHGPHQTRGLDLSEDPATSPAQQPGRLSPHLTWSELIIRIMLRVMRGLVTFRPSRERMWLTARLGRS
ncbi:MAG: hypothetical protein ACN2B6_11510 [Rickettsiales bacterium]